MTRMTQDLLESAATGLDHARNTRHGDGVRRPAPERGGLGLYEASMGKGPRPLDESMEVVNPHRLPDGSTRYTVRHSGNKVTDVTVSRNGAISTSRANTPRTRAGSADTGLVNKIIKAVKKAHSKHESVELTESKRFELIVKDDDDGLWANKNFNSYADALKSMKKYAAHAAKLLKDKLATPQEIINTIIILDTKNKKKVADWDYRTNRITEKPITEESDVELTEGFADGTVETFLHVLIANLTQWDQKHGTPYSLALMLGAEQKIEKALKADLKKSDPGALGRLKKAIEKGFTNSTFRAKTFKAIDKFLADGKPPKYPMMPKARKKKGKYPVLQGAIDARSMAREEVEPMTEDVAYLYQALKKAKAGWTNLGVLTREYQGRITGRDWKTAVERLKVLGKAQTRTHGGALQLRMVEGLELDEAMTGKRLLDAALKHVQSASIRKWATEGKNHGIWIKLADMAIKDRKGDDPKSFATFITAQAIGLW